MFRLAMAWLCVATALAAGEPVPEVPPPSETFQALWDSRPIRQQPTYRMVFVRVVGEPTPAGQRQSRIRLTVLADPAQAEPVKPYATVATWYDFSGVDKPPAPGAEVYLVLVHDRAGADGQSDFRLTPMRYALRAPPAPAEGDGRPSGPVSVRQRCFLPVGPPEGPLGRAVTELLLAPPPEPAERLTALLRHASSADSDARDFAASLAAATGIPLPAPPADAEAREAFAALVLSSDDLATRRRLAQAYRVSEADILPDRPETLGRLLNHDDQPTAQAVAANLRHAADRAESLRPLLEPLLTAPVDPPTRRIAVLGALWSWGERALLFESALRALATDAGAARPNSTDRWAALGILLDAGVADAEALILATLDTVRSSVAMEHAVRLRLNAVVPGVLEGPDARKAWTVSRAHAVALLTGEDRGTDFEPYADWWARQRQAGLAEALLAHDFLAPQAQQQARQWVEQLASDRFEQRRHARQALSAIRPVPRALLDALASDDPEVARSARTILEQAQADLATTRRALQIHANQERAVGAHLNH